MEYKKPQKRRKQQKRKKLDIYDTDHPFRRTAIDIIKSVIEPLMQRGINGEQYYHLENSLTLAINKRLKNVIKTNIKPDLTETNSNKILENDHLNPEDDDDFYEDDDDNLDDDDDDNENTNFKTHLEEAYRNLNIR